MLINFCDLCNVELIEKNITITEIFNIKNKSIDWWQCPKCDTVFFPKTKTKILKQRKLNLIQKS